MKWINTNRGHLNTDLMQAFYWSRGKLWVHWLGEDSPESYDDPNRETYTNLCLRLLLKPIEEGSYGQG